MLLNIILRQNFSSICLVRAFIFSRKERKEMKDGNSSPAIKTCEIHIVLKIAVILRVSFSLAGDTPTNRTQQSAIVPKRHTHAAPR